MAAYEEKVPVVEEAEQRQRSTMEEYKERIICGNVMPDSFLLQDDSLTETKTGLAKWPSVYYTNIEKFLF